MDPTNIAILKKLKDNGRNSWQAIGKHINLTGQAVAARVALMEHKGIISGYTIKQDNLPRHFVTIFMNDGRFEEFEKFIQADEGVESAHKVSGEGCYQLVIASSEPNALKTFLDKLTAFARYRVLSSIRKIK